MNSRTHGTALSTCAAALLALFALSAHAQQSTPAPAHAAPAATTVAVPPIQCEKPADTPLLDPSSAHLKRFQKQVDDYKVCVNEYSRSMGAKSNEYADQARAYAAAANGAIDDYNTYVTALNARAKGESGDVKQGPSSGSKPKY
ncbi:MAG: hypothetical protein ACR2GP_05860 [Burkholderiaceae bacterium]